MLRECGDVLDALRLIDGEALVRRRLRVGHDRKRRVQRVLSRKDVRVHIELSDDQQHGEVEQRAVAPQVAYSVSTLARATHRDGCSSGRCSRAANSPCALSRGARARSRRCVAANHGRWPFPLGWRTWRGRSSSSLVTTGEAPRQLQLAIGFFAAAEAHARHCSCGGRSRRAAARVAPIRVRLLAAAVRVRRAGVAVRALQTGRAACACTSSTRGATRSRRHAGPPSS